MPALALAASVLLAAAPAPTPAGTPAPAGTSTVPPTATPSTSPTQSDGTLQILAYHDYLEYGGVSPDANWTGTFEKETGCRLARLDAVQTAEEMADRLAERPYDLVAAGPVVAASLIGAGRVQPIDTARVEGYDDIPERLRDLLTDSGKVYGVPFLWGSHEFLYDPRRVRDGDLEQALGSPRAMLRDSPLTLADAALAGGADDPYELTEQELEEAAGRLEKGGERTYWRNQLDLVKGFATGSIDYGQATPYLRLLLERAGRPVKAVPARRTTGWTDSWMLGSQVTATDCAYRWLNRMSEPETQREAAAWTGLAPANTKACKEQARSVCEAYGATKPQRLDRIVFATRPPGGCLPPEGECTDYDATWTQRWRELTD